MLLMDFDGRVIKSQPLILLVNFSMNLDPNFVNFDFVDLSLSYLLKIIKSIISHLNLCII